MIMKTKMIIILYDEVLRVIAFPV